jgi:hypothetical protein
MDLLDKKKIIVYLEVVFLAKIQVFTGPVIFKMQYSF